MKGAGGNFPPYAKNALLCSPNLAQLSTGLRPCLSPWLLSKAGNIVVPEKCHVP